VEGGSIEKDTLLVTALVYQKLQGRYSYQVITEWALRYDVSPESLKKRIHDKNLESEVQECHEMYCSRLLSYRTPSRAEEPAHKSWSANGL